MRLAEAMLARGSDRAAVTGTMREAHALARSMGAEPIRLTVEALARRARVSLEPGPARDQPAAGAGARGALTPREQEVLELVAAGCSNRQIADRLFIGERTAGVHVSNILTKLGVERRTEAVAVGRQLGLLDDAVALGGQLLP
jgi:DNA-binding NarL/FixJ family response regulator